MDTTPYWLATGRAGPFPAFPVLERDVGAEVLVVGGGICGLTAAYLLQKAGKRVVLLERGRIGEGQTGHTTAHITYVTDRRLSALAGTFGKERARAFWEAGMLAMEQIQTNVLEEEIECQLRTVPGYLVAAAIGAAEAGSEARTMDRARGRAESAPAAEGRRLHEDEQVSRLRDDARLAEEFGFDAAWLGEAPIFGRPAIRFNDQLKFHPLRYLAGLAQAFVRRGGLIFEHSEAAGFDASTRVAKSNGKTVHYEHLLMATHVPLQGHSRAMGATLLQSKLAPYSTYAIEGCLPAGSVPEGLFWDTAEPYHYLRIDRQPEADVVILGGEDHKTGQERRTCEHFARLEAFLHGFWPGAQVRRRWSGQVVEPYDGLPLIGETAEGQFIATGFAGNGMTLGTFGAVLARDWVLQMRNPWADLLKPGRKTLAAMWEYLKENTDYPFHLVRDRFGAGRSAELPTLARGEGRVVRVRGERLAVARTADGHLVALSAVCTHMGCTVQWNAAEQTWDCPCHGSRFRVDGEILSGPAERPLERQGMSEPIGSDM